MEMEIKIKLTMEIKRYLEGFILSVTQNKNIKKFTWIAHIYNL